MELITFLYDNCMTSKSNYYELYCLYIRNSKVMIDSLD